MANGQMRVEAERSLVFPPDVVQEEEDDDNSSIEIPEAMCPSMYRIGSIELPHMIGWIVNRALCSIYRPGRFNLVACSH